MDDLISRQAAIERIRKQMDRDEAPGIWADNDRVAKVCYEIVIEALEHLPVVQPERMMGEWRDTGSGQVCSECGEFQPGYDNFRFYCSYCGARMDKRKEDGDA